MRRAKTQVLVTILAMIAVAGAPLATEAQDAPMGQKLEGAEWYEVTRLAFHPGKIERAQEIIRDHFAPAAAAAGTSVPAMLLWHNTGDYHLTVVWKLDGLSDLEWKISPDQAKWFQAMAQQAGGMEQAQAIMQEYEGLIAKAETHLAHTLDMGLGGGTEDGEGGGE